MATQTFTDSLAVIDCGVCGVNFGISSTMHNRLKRSGDWFWCPSGHRIHYYESGYYKAQKEVARLKDRVILKDNALQSERRSHAYTEKRRAAEKGAKTRIKNRVAKGVCPCCNRTFQNLARHMEGQHPDFTGAEPND